MTLHVPDLSTDVETNASARFVTSEISLSGPYRNFFKRFFDLVLVLIAAPVLVPLIGILALVVSLSGGTPFYSQMRVGRDGRHFRMWKLRTMIRDADAALVDFLQDNPHARAEWDSTQKLKDDPRITRFGRLLRKTSMDELPQLFNVLNGTMSLVGPRPMMVQQKADYHGHAYFTLRPGITGLWQVTDRNNCTFADRVGFDNDYSRTLSLKTDISILWRTVGVVMRATGH